MGLGGAKERRIMDNDEWNVENEHGLNGMDEHVYHRST